MVISLACPQTYTTLSKEEKDKVCNGCGAKGSILSNWVPNGKLRECCNIHDYMYFTGSTENDKNIADRVFYNNMKRVVNSLTGWVKVRYSIQAKIFHIAVQKFGGYAFWSDKVHSGLCTIDIDLGL